LIDGARNILLKNMSLVFRDQTLNLYSWISFKKNLAELIRKELLRIISLNKALAGV
jgi:hypothetical protein